MLHRNWQGIFRRALASRQPPDDLRDHPGGEDHRHQPQHLQGDDDGARVHLVGDSKDTVDARRCGREVGVGKRNAGPVTHRDGNSEAARDRQGDEQQRERYELDEPAQSVDRDATAGLRVR